MKRKQTEPLPEQIQPALDPNPPTSDDVYAYYILTEPNSPSIAPPNALDKIQYQRAGVPVQQFLHDAPDDFRRPWGYVTYEHELTFAEIDRYNLLPFDPTQIILFDLWISFGKDKPRLLAFLSHFFRVIENDPEQKRLLLASRLIAFGLTPKQITTMVKAIP